MKKLIVLLMSVFYLSGCTALLWSGIDNKQVVRTASKYEHLSDDSIVSFGKLKSTSQLVMIGRNFLYVISNDDSKEISPLLMTKLPNAFQIQSSEITGLVNQDGKTFSSEFRLSYLPKNKSEISILETLRFVKKGEIYVKNYYVRGDIYKTMESVNKEYDFMTPIPVSLDIYSGTESSINAAVLIERIVYTPVMLMMDIVAIPFALTVGAISMAVGGSSSF